MTHSAKKNCKTIATLPKAQVYQRPNGTLLVLRHPNAKQEEFKDLRSFNCTIKKIDSAWNTINALAKKHGAKVTLLREDFYGSETEITFACQYAKCGFKWSQRYELMKNVLRRILKNNQLVDHQSRFFCPECRKALYQSLSRASQYKTMTNKQLLIKARTLPDKALKMLMSFYRYDSVLAQTMRARNSDKAEHLLREFSLERQWRQPRKYLFQWKEQQWREFLEKKEFINVTHWKNSDPRSQWVCYQENKNTFYPELVKTYLTAPILLHNGHRFDSVAEVYIAMILDTLGIKYQVHQPWGFTYKNGKRQLKSDFTFKVGGASFVIESWLVSKANLKTNEKKDKYLLDYLERRDYKTQMAKAIYPDTTLIEIESRVLKLFSTLKFFNHVCKKLSMVGLKQTAEIKFEDLNLIKKTNVLLWDEDDFFEECVLRNYKQLTDLPPSFQNILRSNPYLHLELTKKLANHFSYPLNTRFYLALSYEIINYLSNKPQLHSKSSYQNAHKKGQLPHGFPQDPVEIYTDIESWPELFGKEKIVFFDFKKAKRVVQSFGFRSRDEFLQARSSNKTEYDILKKVLGNPGNTVSGGYSEFTNWADFLGYDKKVTKLERITKEQLKILINGSVLQASRLIKKTLNISSRSQLREKFSQVAINHLNNNPKVPDIDIICFGSTGFLNKNINTISQKVPLKYLRTEKHWHEARQQKLSFRRYPAKLYRYLAEPSGRWSDVVEYLATKLD